VGPQKHFHPRAQRGITRAGIAQESASLVGRFLQGKMEHGFFVHGNSLLSSFRSSIYKAQTQTKKHHQFH
jgi:hypothetical protein